MLTDVLTFESADLSLTFCSLLEDLADSERESGAPENAPDMLFCLVGDTGFEPVASAV
jgi:hypothetical protein